MASGPLRILLLHLCLQLLAFRVSCEDDVTLQSVMTLVQQQTETMLQHTATMLQQSATIQSLQARLGDLETSDRQQSSALSSVNTRLNARAFFTAHMGHENVNIGSNNSPYRFDTVVSSDGGDSYNPQTGVFTAPASGVYVFYAQIMAPGTNFQVIHYAIMKAGVALCTNAADEGNNWDKSSCLVAAHVQKGEAIFVRSIGGGNIINGGVWCSFSGLLVAADP